MTASANRKNSQYGSARAQDDINISELLADALRRFQIKERLEIAAKWCMEHPHLAIFFIVGLLVFALPMLMFLGFVLSTIVIMFTGFLFLEGTMLAGVSMLLLVCLGTIATVFILLIVFMVVAYFGFSHIYNLCGGFSRQKWSFKELILSESNETDYDEPTQSI